MVKDIKQIRIIPSKSYAHRAYICDLLAGPGRAGVVCDLDSDDIQATRGCLDKLRESSELLEAGESGSTLRFIIPLAGVLGKPVLIKTRGRLQERPMGPFEDELERHGMTIKHLPEGMIRVSGKLTPGEYRLPGSISSQFITGLLLSLPYLDGDSRIILMSHLQSSAYVEITIDVLKSYGIEIRRIENCDTADRITGDTDEKGFDIGAGAETAGYAIPGGQKYYRESPYVVEGDWSQAAFWLAAGAIGKAPVSITGLDPESVQGDRKIVDVLRSFGARIEIEKDVCAYPSDLTRAVIDVSEIPDLAPAIACAAAAASGETRLIHAERLKFKESDRIASIVRCLTDLGVAAEGTDNEIIIHGCGAAPAGGIAETAGDHRIVMMAAVISLITRGKVTITGSSAVSKSYPAFFSELEHAGLAGNILRK